MLDWLKTSEPMFIIMKSLNATMWFIYVYVIVCRYQQRSRAQKEKASSGFGYR